MRAALAMAVAAGLTAGLLTGCGSAGPGGVTPADPAQASAAAAAASPAAEPTGSFEMPDVVGMKLQDARDLLQSRGSYLMDQVGAQQLQPFGISAADLKVCAQQPAAGQTVPVATKVTLDAAQASQECPS